MRRKITSPYRATFEMLDNRVANEEYFVRMMVTVLIGKIPIEDLKELIKLKKIDPRTSEIKEKILSSDTPLAERNFLINLKEEGIVYYEIEL